MSKVKLKRAKIRGAEKKKGLSTQTRIRLPDCPGSNARVQSPLCRHRHAIAVFAAATAPLAAFATFAAATHTHRSRTPAASASAIAVTVIAPAHVSSA